MRNEEWGMGNGQSRPEVARCSEFAVISEL